MRLLPLLFAGVIGLGCRPPANLPKAVPIDFANTGGPSVFSAEATLEDRWDGGVLLRRWTRGEPGHFQGVDGLALRYTVHRASPSKGAVVLVPGRTEAMMKWVEVIDDLVANGYTAYALDVRGQGASDRMLPNHDKGHVRAFDDYVTDMETFVRNVVRKEEPKNVFVLAHSMGGAIATLFLDEHPDLVTAVALSSPMLEINTGGFPAPVASSLGLTACGMGDGTDYALGYGDFKDETDFTKSSVSNSEPRWRWKVALYKAHPEVRVGGVTWRWLCESLNASSRAATLGRYATVPTLLLQAGSDTVVKPGSQDRYCTESPTCQKSTFPTAKHELLNEVDPIRNEALSQVLKFFAAKGNP